MTQFASPVSGAEQEEGLAFRPKFDSSGLITAVAVDHETGEVLMLAHMNAQALERTLATGTVHYWSRSRGKMWIKGETSGNTQTVVEVLTDCDQDAVVLRVRQEGVAAACHTGRVSCFYRKVIQGEDGSFVLEKDPRPARFDPSSVYGSQGDG
ncbi:MAG: phosphoribosyl-AMP cyclohydrolase [Nitratireductor sp.]|nr:phosphoribosyl-AMP cyclohydrolase [Nitratireductor sp.]MCC0019641.1 phosphoribosyl-AMP cyclohydrolase [Nitratireductor sp.]